MVDFRLYYRKLKEDLRTTAGRNILTFFIFLLISTIFWFLMALNDEVQEDFKVPVVLEGFPENMTVISGGVSALNVTIKDKGSALTKFAWGAKPGLKLRYDDFLRPRDNHLLFNETQLNSALRDVFGSSASLIAIRPDSIHLNYTTNPGIPVRVILDADVTTLPQYEAFGSPMISTDSVMLFSNLKERLKIKELSTEPIALSRLSDTTTVDVAILVPEGMRAVPSKVRVTFPIEPLVAKTRKLKVETINLPDGIRLIPFPAMVEATFLLPKSMYSVTNSTLRVVVDYNDVVHGKKTLPLKLSGVPRYYQGARLLTREVEFLIEQD